MSTKPDEKLFQEGMETLGSRLSEDVKGEILPKVLSIVAEHNREAAFRLTFGQDNARLRTGSKVCMEVWGTVYGTTPDGRALIVPDSDSHHGLIVAPPDTKLCPMGFDAQDSDKKATLMTKARKAMKQAESILATENSTRNDAHGRNKKGKARRSHHAPGYHRRSSLSSSDSTQRNAGTPDCFTLSERGGGSHAAVGRARSGGVGDGQWDYEEGGGDGKTVDGPNKKKRPDREGVNWR